MKEKILFSISEVSTQIASIGHFDTGWSARKYTQLTLCNLKACLHFSSSDRCKRVD
jgi:hypothetical protein